MRQRRNFEAYVLEYAALKIPAFPFQDEKCVFCKFAQHPHLASAAASLRKATPQPASDRDRLTTTERTPQPLLIVTCKKAGNIHNEPVLSGVGRLGRQTTHNA